MTDGGFIDIDMIEEFYVDVDKLAEQVANGMNMLKGGFVSEGINQMMRPLHTVKGTTAFFGQSGLSEFMAISTLSHRTEDLLKDIQSGAISCSGSMENLMEAATNTIFSGIDMIRCGEPIDEAAFTNLAADLERAKKGNGDNFELETVDGVHLIRVPFKRIHLPKQYKDFVAAVERLPAGDPIAIDLKGVLTMSSSAWGKVVELAGRNPISLFSASESVRHIYMLSGFDQYLAIFDDEEAFWASRNENSPGDSP